MLCSFAVRVLLPVILVCGVVSPSFAEPVRLESSAVNTVQIKALKLRGEKIFEIQLGGGANQPATNTWIAGKAFTVVGKKKYSGYYRLSTDPKRQLKMKLKAAARSGDEYSFFDGYDVLYFEFAPTTSFNDPWLTAQIEVTSAVQPVFENDNQNNGNGNQNGNQNNGNQNGNQNNGGQNDGDKHPPISLAGKISAPTGGSLSKRYGAGDSQLLLNVGGNQRLAVLQLGNSLSGMSLQIGSYSPQRP